MYVKHEAFLDLESLLKKRWAADWKTYWSGFSRPLKTALEQKDYHLADHLADLLSTYSLVKVNKQYAEKIGVSSLLLGASRLSPLRSSVVFSRTPLRPLAHAVTQWGVSLGRLLTLELQKRLHVRLAAWEYLQHRDEQEIAKDDTIADLLDSMGEDGENISDLAASLLVSRLSNYGFFLQAAEEGVSYYEISAILDDKTCEVCEAMDGQVFNLDDGLSQASAVLNADDPGALKLIAPWPSQDDAPDLEDADAAELVSMGLAMPPYHPFCRCIAIEATQPEESADVEDQQTNQEALAQALDEQSSASTAALLAAAGIVIAALSFTFAGEQDREEDLTAQTDDDLSDDVDDIADQVDDSNQDEEEQRKKRGVGESL